MKNIRVGVEVAKITRIRVERGYLRPSEDPGLRGAEVIIVRKSFRGSRRELVSTGSKSIRTLLNVLSGRDDSG